MKIPQLLLGLVLAIAGLLLAAALLPEPPGGVAAPHPERPSLLVGAPAPPALLVLGWAFGALQLIFFAACFALGVQRGGRLGPMRRPLWIGLIVYEVLWAVLVGLAAAYARDPGAPLWASFPAPTAWMLFALWPFPLYFAWLFLRHFDGWVLDDRGLAEFRERVEELRARR